MERQRTGADGGAALLEFVVVALLLFTLVFGIIGYATMMSFRQALTQAAAEGARAGAVAPAALTQPQIETRVRDAIERALDGTIDPSRVCGTGADDVQCTINFVNCPGTSTPAPQCVEVHVSYAYRDHPLVPAMPGLGLSLPQNLGFESTAEIN